MEELELLPVVTSACYSLAFARYLKTGLETLYDVWNKVNFVGGNASFDLTYIIIFAIVMIEAIIFCFLQIKTKKE